MDESLAHPSSLLGQIQRGRGAGLLTALAEDPVVVQPLLLSCILGDPRFDRQGEQRADYYACLAIHVHLPLAPLEDYLRSHADDHPWSYSDLPLAALARMAWRGDEEASVILVRYLSYGPMWTEAFEAVVGGGHALHSVRVLGQVILARFPDDTALSEELDCAMFNPTVWDKWTSVEPQVEPILASLRAQVPYVRPTDETIHATVDPAWDVSALLAHATNKSARIYGEVAAERANSSNLSILLDAFFGADTVQMRVASHALTILKLPEALPPLVRFVEEFDGNEKVWRAQYRIGRVRRILAATPEALPIARAWLHAAGRARESVALSVLEEQSEEADVPALRALLPSALDREPSDFVAVNLVESCLEALAPFAAQIPYADLASVFERTRSMWNRQKAAKLMAYVYPTAFCGSYAVECLWDCEDRIVVEIGCTYADLSMPMVRDRLDYLQHSAYENDAVRTRAKERLQASAL